MPKFDFNKLNLINNSIILYYKFLEEENRGVVRYAIKKIVKEGEYYRFFLNSKLKTTEDIQVKAFDKIYNEKTVRVIEYNETKKTVLLRIEKQIDVEFEQIAPENVFIETNLLFLIKNLKEWYAKYGERISFPEETNCIEYNNNLFKKLLDTPSAEQKQAIEGILNHPFSYIWGAPGTGKTKFVLSRCAISYLEKEMNILIVAPTNNAVEQTLYGVLSVLEEAGIPLTNVLRLGIPTHNFFEKYPFLCEDRAAAKNIEQIDKQIERLNSDIAKIEKKLALLPEYKNFIAKQKDFAKCQIELSPLLKTINEYRKKQEEEENRLIVILAKIDLLNKELIENRNTYFSNINEIKVSQQTINRYNNSIIKFFYKKKINRIYDELQKQLILSDKLENDYKTKNKIRSELIETEKEIENDKSKIYIQIGENEKQIYSLVQNFESLKTIISATEKKDVESMLFKELEAIEKQLKILENGFEEFRTINEDKLLKEQQNLLNEKTAYIAKREDISKKYQIKDLSNYKIVATTIDTLITRSLSIFSEFKPKHIFLDESGYCSLIKALPLFAFNCPITFLGDHMQLPPICEMNNNQIEMQPETFLWAESSLYAEDIFKKTMYRLYNDFINNVSPVFEDTYFFALKQTFRFGNSLAAILSESVYTEGLEGNPKCDTEIFYINVKNNQLTKPRENIPECTAIKNYVKSHRESNIGIITPYKNQKTRLTQELNELIDTDENIVTVHGSQGKEWETVLFSVVDTDNKWFTDSQNIKSNGLKVINTAVSRAKRKLIIVCNADFWQTQKQQLIKKLLSIATEIKQESKDAD